MKMLNPYQYDEYEAPMGGGGPFDLAAQPLVAPSRHPSRPLQASVGGSMGGFSDRNILTRESDDLMMQHIGGYNGTKGPGYI